MRFATQTIPAPGAGFGRRRLVHNRGYGKHRNLAANRSVFRLFGPYGLTHAAEFC